ncbi:MAG: hypothetical protein ACPG19_00895 [Saprospiraceae bacterium]
MMKKTIFLSAFVALMLSTQLVFAQQPLSGSELNLTNSYSAYDPVTDQTTTNMSNWDLEFINNDELVFRTSNSNIFRLSNTTIYAEKPMMTGIITSSGNITGTSMIATNLLSGNKISSTSHITVGTKLGIGINGGLATEFLHIAGGFAKSEGFIVDGVSSNQSDWDAPWYGLSNGGANSISLSANSAKPVLLQGFYGVALRTSQGKMTMDSKGTVTIGLNDTDIESIRNNGIQDYKLYVDNGIRSEKVKVDVKTAWPDYVFAKTYQLKPLSEVESFITQNSHLPEVPSAADMDKNGLDVAKMDATLLKKIEELTLYTIQQQKQLELLTNQLNALQEKLNNNENK